MQSGLATTQNIMVVLQSQVTNPFFADSSALRMSFSVSISDVLN